MRSSGLHFSNAYNPGNYSISCDDVQLPQLCALLVDYNIIENAVFGFQDVGRTWQGATHLIPNWGVAGDIVDKPVGQVDSSYESAQPRRLSQIVPPVLTINTAIIPENVFGDALPVPVVDR